MQVNGTLMIDDEDDERFSHHRSQGPIEIEFNCRTTDAGGGWLGAEQILLPTGSLEVPVRITTTGVVGSDIEGTWGTTDGDTIDGETIVDVDRLEAPA